MLSKPSYSRTIASHRIHVPLIQASINRGRTRFELNAELSSLGTCAAYNAEGGGENCRKPRVRPRRRKPLTDSIVNLSAIVLILSDDYQRRLAYVGTFKYLSRERCVTCYIARRNAPIRDYIRKIYISIFINSYRIKADDLEQEFSAIFLKISAN